MGIDVFYKKLKEKYPDLQNTKKQVSDIIKNIELYQEFKTPEVKTPLQVYANEDGQYMADLIFIPKHKTANKGYGIILTIVNMNSRKAYAIPMKSKADVPTVFGEWVEKVTPKITTLQTDKGTEFLNKAMKTIYKKYDISHYTSSEDNHNQLGMIERFNRTLKAKFTRLFHSRGKNEWLNYLDDVIDNYNNTPHSSLKFNLENGGTINKSPLQITGEDMIILRVLARNSNFKEMDEENLNVGDFVRILKQKSQFEKEGSTYSKEIYIIKEQRNFSYVLEDLNGELKRGEFKPYQILKVDKNITKTKRVTRGDTNAINLEKDEKDKSRQKRFLRKEGII